MNIQSNINTCLFSKKTPKKRPYEPKKGNSMIFESFFYIIQSRM